MNSIVPLVSVLSLFLTVSEQQPRVRGWLLASLDGQTTGLVPANYVKVLGKRRGRHHAEVEAQQMNVSQQPPQTSSTVLPRPNPAPGLTSGLSSAPVPAQSQDLLEAVYRETPDSSLSSNTVLNIPDKTDL